MSKSVISLSGGLDSTVLLANIIAAEKKSINPSEIHGVGFCYGSKHNVYENAAAKLVAEAYDIDYHLIDLSQVMGTFDSALTLPGEAVPDGHYEEESMRRTVVPGRNLIFLSILAGYAESIGADKLYIGVHAGDHFIYPDCRPEFCLAAQRAIILSSDKKVHLRTPFINDSKVDIVRLGLYLQAPLHLTRTCYKDQYIACGTCGSCQERLSAFAANNAQDPIAYDHRELIPKV